MRSNELVLHFRLEKIVLIDVCTEIIIFVRFYILDFQNGIKVSVFFVKNSVKLITMCQLNVWNVVFNIYFIIYSADTVIILRSTAKRPVIIKNYLIVLLRTS